MTDERLRVKPLLAMDAVWSAIPRGTWNKAGFLDNMAQVETGLRIGLVAIRLIREAAATGGDPTKLTTEWWAAVGQLDAATDRAELEV